MSFVRRVAVVLAAISTAAVAACGGASPQAIERPDRPSDRTAISTTKSTGAKKDSDKDKSGNKKDDSKDDSSSTSNAATEDDMKTFAYATSDSALLVSELADISSTLEALYADVSAHDVGAAKSDAQTLLNQAAVLEGDARNAANRLGNLSPSDATLKEARTDGVSAFALTADYAGAVVDLANAALSMNVQQMSSVAQEAASLQGTSDELTASYSELAQELEQWAKENPQAAAAATAKYGG